MSSENRLESLYNRYIRDLSIYATYLGADKEVAMDAIQDVFCKLSAKNNMLADVEDVKLYLFRALKNRLYDLYREQPEHIKLYTIDTERDLPFNFRVTVEDLFIKNEEQIKIKKVVEEMLSTLSSRQREIVYLRYIQECTYEQISELLGITPHACRKHLSKAMQKLKKEYGQQLTSLLLILSLMG